MKCIHCGRISRRRERVDGRCPECGHRFAFDPETRPGAGTDAEFQEAIDRVSGGGQLWFTARQLWLAANVPLRMPTRPGSTASSMVTFALIFGFPLLVLALFSGMPAMLIIVLLGSAAGAAVGWGAAQDEMRKYAYGIAPRGPFETFLRYQLQPWLRVHGEIPGLLPQRGTDAAAAPPQATADAAAFDCAVVTDRWETAQMLVANRFHAVHNCAVLSRDGYPDGHADALRQALRRTPRLTVFALHDASTEGCQLPLELREPEWFPDPSVRVVDLGVRPETIRRLDLLAIPGQPVPSWTLPERLSGLLSYDDRQWLATGNVYELAALPPEQLMRAANRGIVSAGRNDGSGGTPAYDDACWNGVGIWFGSLAATGADMNTAADHAAVAMAR